MDVLSLGPPVSVELMRETLAMGADRATLLSYPHSSGSSRLNIAHALSAAIRSMAPYDLVLLGSGSRQGGSGQLGSQMAQLLDLPFINDVENIVRTDSELRIERAVKHIDHIKETCKIDLPAMLAMSKRALRSEDKHMFGIAAAFEDLEVDILPLSALDLDQEPVEISEQSACIPPILSVRSLAKEHRTIVPTGERVEKTDELVRSLTFNLGH